MMRDYTILGHDLRPLRATLEKVAGVAVKPEQWRAARDLALAVRALDDLGAHLARMEKAARAAAVERDADGNEVLERDESGAPIGVRIARPMQYQADMTTIMEASYTVTLPALTSAHLMGSDLSGLDFAALAPLDLFSEDAS